MKPWRCVPFPLEVTQWQANRFTPPVGEGQQSDGTMIVGIGIDLFASRRMERELRERPGQSVDGIFTGAELQRCGTGQRRPIRLSACFAAKEATLKALGAEVSDLEWFREVEIVDGPGGAPTVVLHSRARLRAQHLGVRHIWLSIASAKEHAGAFVVLES